MSNKSVLNAFGGAGRSGSGAKITIPSFNNVKQDVKYLPPGKYQAKVSKFKQDVSGAGNEMLVFEFDVKAPNGVLKGRRLFCPLTANALWKLHRVCDALGIDSGEVDVSDVIGRKCMVNIVDDGQNDNGDKYCKIASCAPS